MEPGPTQSSTVILDSTDGVVSSTPCTGIAPSISFEGDGEGDALMVDGDGSSLAGVSKGDGNGDGDGDGDWNIEVMWLEDCVDGLMKD